MSQSAMKIYLFYCSNSLSRNQIIACNSECTVISDGGLRTIGLPCSGKVAIQYLIKAFETGADGVIIATCPEDKCRNIEGNMRAKKRAEMVDSLLEEIGMTKGRITVIRINEDRPDQTIKQIIEFCNKLKSLPVMASVNREKSL